MPTKTFNHAVTVYNALDAEARDATEGRVFEGSFKAVVKSCDDVPDDYYQRVRNLLGELGCLRYLRTGHGNTKSLIQLNCPPTIELYNEFRENANKGGKRSASNEVVLGRINDIAKRMTKLEAEMRTVMGVVRERLGPKDGS